MVKDATASEENEGQGTWHGSTVQFVFFKEIVAFACLDSKARELLLGLVSGNGKECITC